MILDDIKKGNFYLDGAMGTVLQSRGLKAGEKPELWNLTRPEEIIAVHRAYFDAGSNLVCTNTFGANILKFSEEELSVVIKSAVDNAKRAREQSKGGQNKYIALDIGPLGKLLKPYGDLSFEEAVSIFGKTVRLGAKEGVDAIYIETMNDSYETKSAVLGAKENCSLPIFVTNAYGEDGKLMTGATPTAMAVMLEGLGVSAIGANCSFGPDKLLEVGKEILSATSLPVILKPNAGLPTIKEGKTVYDLTEEDFAKAMCKASEEGISILGGCCGTTPVHIAKMYEKTHTVYKKYERFTPVTAISSYAKAVVFGDKPVLIGERINPTGKKRFKRALVENDIDYILGEGVSQKEKGASVLDVNVGIPDIDESELLPGVIERLQAVVDLPLQIDTSNYTAMEKAMRLYNGKPLINSVNGKKESMEAIFPLVKKYGGVVVALTLDEKGIPSTASGRVKIAKKILRTAKKYGVSKENIIFDTLTMTVSADKNSAKVTLDALKIIKEKLGCHTVLGVSNVSFGLPNRDALNSAFFTMALNSGLSSAIINPCSSEMLKAYYTYCALSGKDENFENYILRAEEFTAVKSESVAVVSEKVDYSSALTEAIVKGFKERAGELTKEMLKSVEPLTIVQNEIIPALNIVGEGFEKKTVYLPALLMSAESAKCAFEQIKSALPANANENGKTIVLATVKGDIHDIGKNIVKLLLENYGFKVIDLGKDIPPESVLEATLKYKAEIVGLSALMTTTVPAMKETIDLLRKNAPSVKIVVGGAVLTEEYAKVMGADKYARDGMETVRYAQSV